MGRARSRGASAASGDAPKKLCPAAIRRRPVHPAVRRPSTDTVLPPGRGVVYVEGRRHGVATSGSPHDGRRLRRSSGARSYVSLIQLMALL